MPLFEVDTLVQFRHKYVIEAECLDHAYDTVVMRESGCDKDYFDEVSQLYLGETIIDGREITRTDFHNRLNELSHNPREMCSHWVGEELIYQSDNSESTHNILVFKNGIESGWFKDIEAGKNAIIVACKVHGFDIEEYEFRDKFTKKVLWKGARADLGV